ncbi:HET-domain-containing protein [Thozetella sp. PMI_491]|nr:HET-domain-containing protein [Thozetella sp. PMI_491]
MDAPSPTPRRPPPPPAKPKALTGIPVALRPSALATPPLPPRPSALASSPDRGDTDAPRGSNETSSPASFILGAIRGSAEKTGAAFAVAGAAVQKGAISTAGVLKDGWDHTSNAVGETSVGVLLTHVQGDIRDTGRKLSQKDSLCEQCARFPVSACWVGGSGAETLEWSTPLMRVVGNSGWCRLCQLLLEMLCRPGNDPLDHPEVRRHAPEAIQNYSMKTWASMGPGFVDETWPFGRCEEPDDNSTYVFGDIGKGFQTFVTDKDRVYGLAKSASRTVALANGRRVAKRSYADGQRAGRMVEREKHAKLMRYRRNCDIEVTIFTRNSAEFPGLILARCVGQSGQTGSDPQVLSSFRLRVAHPDIRSNVENPDLELTYGYRMDPKWIDLSVARMWLWECELKHGTECSQHGWEIAMQRPESLRVIDVQRMCIVDSQDPSTCRYVALSYTWGRVPMLKLKYRNLSSLMQEGGLRRAFSMIPRTVLDAMEVVLAMGERYLWVDALCKLQEESIEAATETASMDRIYGSALVTIVAASGDDADHGLVGVQRKQCSPGDGVERNIEQPAAEVNGAHIIAPFRCSQNLHVTIWNTRGWTFQEKLLSRRLLVFSGNEVVWYCRRMSCREDMRDDDSGGTAPPPDWLNLKPKWFNRDQKNQKQQHWVDGSVEVDRFGRTHVVRSGTFAEYTKVVEQYTTRQLTFNSDILFALEGLLNIFEQSFGSKHVFGLPETLFDTALLWRPTQRLKRRVCANGSQFPSWSWAGWEGSVCYERPLVLKRDGDGTVMQYTRGDSGEEGVRPLIQWHTYSTETRRVKPINMHGWGVPVTGKALPREWEGCPFGDRQTYTAERLQFPGVSVKAHHLVFRTSSVDSFRLGSGRVSDTNPIGRRLPPTQFPIQNARGAVGTITLDSEDDFSLVKGKHEFLLLSECHRLGVEGQDDQIGDFRDYNVMLVEKNVISGTYERLGLGRIMKQAWAAETFQAKTIVLG